MLKLCPRGGKKRKKNVPMAEFLQISEHIPKS